MGRFVSGDTMETGDGFFRYTGNNPIMRVDPSGHMTLVETVAVVAVIAAITFSATNTSTVGYKRDASALDIHVKSRQPNTGPGRDKRVEHRRHGRRCAREGRRWEDRNTDDSKSRMCGLQTILCLHGPGRIC